MVGRFTDPSLVQRAAEAVSENAQQVVEELRQRPLKEVLLLLEWVFPAGSAAVQGQPDYLDGSCLVYSEDRLLDVVDFRGAHSAAVGCHGHKASSATHEWSAGKGKTAVVAHSGDVMAAEGGSHVIRVRLADLPDYATDCYFVISAYNCRNLSLFQSLNMRVFDADCPSSLLSKFTNNEAGCASAVVVCSLSRRLAVWSIQSFCRACDGTVRDYTPIEAAIAPVQENHSRWRRRRPFVLLSTLCQLGRAHPNEDEMIRRSDVVFPLLRLHAHLFQCVLQYV